MEEKWILGLFLFLESIIRNNFTQMKWNPELYTNRNKLSRKKMLWSPKCILMKSIYTVRWYE